jgi:chromosomal replication initiation ATPase DnaA
MKAPIVEKEKIVDTRPYKVIKAPVTEKEKKERDQKTLQNKVFNMEHRIEKLQDELELLRGQLKYQPKRKQESEERIFLRDIMEAVCDKYKITPDILNSVRRYAEIVRPRSLYINLCLDLTHWGCAHIARTCVNKDHTTVLYHQRQKANRSKHWSLQSDLGLELWADYEELKMKLNKNARRKTEK